MYYFNNHYQAFPFFNGNQINALAGSNPLDSKEESGKRTNWPSASQIPLKTAAS